MGTWTISQRRMLWLPVLALALVAAAVMAYPLPIVSMHSPANGGTYTAPASITVSATAMAADDGLYITSLKLYRSGTLLATTTEESLSYTDTGVPAGTYNYYAVAKDNVGGTKTTASRTVTVTSPANQAPTVQLTAPASGASYIAGDLVEVTATAADTDGSISKVEFFRSGTLIATDTVAPYSINWDTTDLAAASYSLMARATDNGAQSADSAALTVTVNSNVPPTVTLTSPQNNANYTTPATVSLTATATDSDGSVVEVRFYGGGSLLATDTVAPYTATWTNVPIGGHGLQAVAKDNRGATTSAVANIQVGVTGSIMANPNPCPLYDSWQTMCYSTISWNTPDPSATVWESYEEYDAARQEDIQHDDQVGGGTSGSAQFQIRSTQRRHRFDLKIGTTLVAQIYPSQQWAPTVAITTPTNNQVITDPGNLVIAANAADQDGTVTKVEFYSGATLLGTDTAVPYSYTWNNIPLGAYSITAKAYDNAGAVRASSASNFIVNGAPSVSITAPASGAIVIAPANVLIQAAASDSDDSVAMVEFYSGSTKLATDTAAPFELQWNNVAAGTYSLTAKALDNRGGATTSPVTTLIVNTLPTVTLTSPASGTTINAPNSYTLSADASDSDGSITKVEFYSGSTLLDTDTAAPYSYVWSNIPAGSYSITAKATDNRNAVTTSAASTLILNAVPTVSISAPMSDTVVIAPANVLIQANASDADDVVAIVEFYVNGQWKATDTAAPFAFQADNMPAGTYTLTAKAFDNRGGATLSAASTLIVNERPQVQLVSPANDAGVVMPQTMTLAAAASDADGTISKVEFYNGAVLLGTATAAPYQLAWTVSAAGDHSLTARAYDNRGTVTTSAAILLRARINAFELMRDASPTSLSGDLPAHDATVGRLAGQGGASGGTATYTIPIVVPPGRRGIQPELALSYSSRAGNDIAGMGWSLSGLSAIARCPSTLDQDGAIRAVSLDAGDRLCLDGQRLVATSGTYGQSGTTYATEIDSFARVTQLGGALNSANAYFQVETKSGDIVYYGGNSTAASAARVVPGGVTLPLSWLIERRQDRIGNVIRYAYASYGNGETLVSSILYTGFGSIDGNRSVDFIYETRPTTSGGNDQASSYLAGGLTQQTQRLNKIVTWAAAQPVREYRLTYQVSTASQRSLLSTVTECGYAAGQVYCRPSTNLAWQVGAPAYQFGRLAIGTAPGAAALDPAKTYNVTPAGDYDGDGVSDVLWTQENPSNPVLPLLYLASLDGQNNVRWALSLPVQQTFLFRDYAGTDFDLDGKADFIGMDANHNIKVWFWHGPGSATTFEQAFTDSWSTGLAVDAPGDELIHVGDMDGDGRADLVMQKNYPAGGESCARKIQVFRNSSSGAFTLAAEHCLKAVFLEDVFGTVYKTFNEAVPRVGDFNGDGLPDLFVLSHGYGGAWGYDRVMLGQRSSGTYSLQAVLASALFPAGDPRQEGEFSGGTASGFNERLMDINGDGLDDLLYTQDARWHGRINRGGQFGTRIQFENTAGLSACAWDFGSGGPCGQYMQSFDYDADGRLELMVPRQFAVRVCSFRAWTPTNSEVNAHYVCPENPLTGALDTGDYAIFDGGGEFEVREMYGSGQGAFNTSKYYGDALRFVQTGVNQYRIDRIPTSIVLAKGQPPQDLRGDGLTDLLVSHKCVDLNCGIPTANANGVPFPDAVSPQFLPDGTPVRSAGIFINRNVGANGGIPNPDGVTPQIPDMLALVTDGLGVQTGWTYYPLSSKGGRGAGDTPLYTIPSDPAARYIDDKHFYFTSSMPVVSDMIQSDGIGDYRSLRYSYSEAMYNARGRGFQGFRTIIEEDEANGTRTITSFHQKYPLTSQPEEVVVSPISRAGTSGAIKRERYTWRCNRANRADAAACASVAGGSIAFPYLDAKESWTYDAATAVSGGEAAMGYVQEVNADDATCSGSYSNTSGYDAYGNLTARTVHARDVGTGPGGFRAFLSDQCQREQSTFTVDTGNWWLDKLTAKTVTASISWNSGEHALPGSTSNPAQTVTRQYTWNADRTPDSETLQPGIPYQQRITQYGYPASGNYGLPETVSVTASGDPNGTRSTVTTYSPDGYFPIAIRNQFNHTAWTSVRLRDGQPVSTTDANGLRTLIEYDAFGLPVLTQYRGRTDQEYLAPDKHVAMTRCDATGCGTAFAAYQLMTVQDGSPTTLARFDALGRPRLQAERQMDGEWTHVFTEYNSRGLTARQSEPFRNGDTAYWTQFTSYDLLGRVTRKVAPQQAEDGRGDRVTTYAYRGRETAIQVCGSTDSGTANCLNLSRTTDALGRYVETRDANNGRTRFWYDAMGNTLALEDANGVVTRAAYNALGQRSSVNDPNQGIWNFNYNALGELLNQTDARNITTHFAYDTLGRPKERRATVEVTGDSTADEVIDRWTYDPSNALGAEASNERTINGVVERTTAATYDALARPGQLDITQALTSGTASYRLRTRYDSYYGRPVGQEFPNGEAVEFLYSAYGHAVQERDPATGTVYRTLGGTNARGQPTLETFGGTLQTRPGYSPTTGQVTELLQQANGIEVRRLGYGYDLYGNLTRQTLNGGQSQEAYHYDNLHRLIDTTRTGAATGTVTYGYDAVGNFAYKSDFSLAQPAAYGYSSGGCGGGPNAVKSVLTSGGTRTYCYDANGNLTGDSNGLSLKYDHANLPVIAQRGAARDEFRYGTDNQRTRSWGADGARVYLPGYEHRTDTGETKVYVGDYAVISRQGGTRKVEYLLKDRLGSVDAVANASGTVTETRGYDAFGKPRSGTWADLDPARLQSTSTTPKGFTQHEHLNQIELIHMNGRAFDYNLGRFTGVDPFIQFPLNSQSLNPYSYIRNNPLSGTDPTGYKSREECNRRQSCQMQGNMLNDLQSEMRAMSGAMGAGIKTMHGTRGGGDNGAAMGGGPDAKQTINSGTYKINAADQRSNVAANGDNAHGADNGDAATVGSNYRKLSHEEYDTFDERETIYRSMNDAVVKAEKDTVWFGAAADVNAVFKDNEWSMPSKVEKYLNNLGISLFEKNNITMFEQVMAGKYDHLPGGRIDNMLVHREQQAVERYNQAYFRGGAPLTIRAYMGMAFSEVSSFNMPPGMKAGYTRAVQIYQDVDYFNLAHREQMGFGIMKYRREAQK